MERMWKWSSCRRMWGPRWNCGLAFSIRSLTQLASFSFQFINLSTAFLGKCGAGFVLLIHQAPACIKLALCIKAIHFLLVSYFFNDWEYGVKIKALPLVLLWFDVADPFQACPGLNFAFGDTAHFDWPETSHFDYQKHAGFRKGRNMKLRISVMWQKSSNWT